MTKSLLASVAVMGIAIVGCTPANPPPPENPSTVMVVAAPPGSTPSSSPLVEATPTPASRSYGAIDFTQGIWLATCKDDNPHKWYMQFLQDGTARYDYNQGDDPLTFTYHNAVWKVEGGQLITDYNQGYAVDTFPLSNVQDGMLRGVPAHTRHCDHVALRPYRGQ